MQNQSTENSVRRQLLALTQMDKEELISKWQDLFGTTPPEYGTLFMRKRLAHRIQELFYGESDQFPGVECCPRRFAL